MKYSFYTCISITLFLVGCGINQSTISAIPKTESHENLNATLWVQTSVEYKMACEQTYRWAYEQLLKNLEDKTVTAAEEQTNDYSQLPPAIIVDIDETILDNSPFEARLIAHNKSYNDKLWNDWVNEEKALPVPGAKKFLKLAEEKGIKVFYVTNRDSEHESQTVTNLQKEINITITDNDVLLKNEKPEWISDKTSRRAFLSKEYRILLLIGDDYNDFTYLGKADVIKRHEISKNQQDKWGKLWFVLPGPTYGSYENALLDYDYSLTPEQRLNKKMTHLKTEE